MSDHWIECQGHDGQSHKIHKSSSLYDGLCAWCAIKNIRATTADPECSPVSPNLVRGLLTAYDRERKDHQDEVNFISRQAAEDIEEAADRARWEATRDAERGSWFG